MRNIVASTLIGSLLAFSCLYAHAENYQQERQHHPRIAHAIHELKETIKYMEAAPHDFGGHKAAAIASSKQAITDLQEALKYREAQDTKKGK
jgi:hypothetical protein